jgi:hypothetical protein
MNNLKFIKIIFFDLQQIKYFYRHISTINLNKLPDHL